MAPNRLSQAWYRITEAAKAVCAQTNQPFPEALSTQRGDVYARQVVRLEAVAALLEAVAGGNEPVGDGSKHPKSAAKGKSPAANPAAEVQPDQPAAETAPEPPAKAAKSGSK